MAWAEAVRKALGTLASTTMPLMVFRALFPASSVELRVKVYAPSATAFPA
jgi:hypothetical protein